jgi:hypothetical protein
MPGFPAQIKQIAPCPALAPNAGRRKNGDLVKLENLIGKYGVFWSGNLAPTRASPQLFNFHFSICNFHFDCRQRPGQRTKTPRRPEPTGCLVKT